MVKAVLFDVDGVLIDSFEANFTFFQRILPKAGYPAPTREQYHQMFHLSLVDLVSVFVGHDQPEAVEKVVLMAKDRTDYPLELVKMPVNAPRIIQQLSKKYLVGIVTSRIRIGVESIPQLQALFPYLSVKVVFEDTEKHKPDPEPIFHATKQLHISPNNAVYIGDAVTDFQAARQAGAQTIMYQNESVVGADGYVSSFSQIPKTIKQLELKKNVANL